MQGLYTDDELNSENIKDKDSKMAFLQKAIDVVGTFLHHLYLYNNNLGILLVMWWTF